MHFLLLENFHGLGLFLPENLSLSRFVNTQSNRNSFKIKTKFLVYQLHFRSNSSIISQTPYLRVRSDDIHLAFLNQWHSDISQ